MISPIFITILSMLANFSQNYTKEVNKNGMAVQWEIVKDSLHVIVFAPTQGWVAIGFNEQDELTGTHLIMGSVKNGEVHIEDRYIRKPGDHVSVRALGGVDAVAHQKGEENENGTRIAFHLPLKVQDSYHWLLAPGKPYYLLLAYSESDDFYHHSRMRTSVKIQL
ncbi:MAG: DOMON domain-containing protein [Saprospiraceae bacterium]